MTNIWPFWVPFCIGMLAGAACTIVGVVVGMLAGRRA